jgi:hypothetical protein
MMIMVASHFLKRKESKLQRLSARIVLLAFSRIMGELVKRFCAASSSCLAESILSGVV